MEQCGHIPIGVVNGEVLYVSHNMLAQYGIDQIREHFGLTRRFHVVTDLSGNVVMVAATTQDDAIQKYLNRVT
jgi:hypothetical protein